MGLMWFFLGTLALGSFWLLQSWKRNTSYKISLIAQSSLILSALLALFSISWTISSLAEGETRAAGMGLAVFGGIAIILFAVTWQIIVKKRRTVLKENNSKSLGQN
ncbi:MAG: dehalogenase [Dehalobacter sp. 4CP]|uniref:dehalogenase n=1 Tax=Dehalobacter sp. CP TaxID=2594474 RepID=UPI0013CD7775|nr:dehalogenase [Dehalobacter sp. 4CP]